MKKILVVLFMLAFTVHNASADTIPPTTGGGGGPYWPDLTAQVHTSNNTDATAKGVASLLSQGPAIAQHENVVRIGAAGYMAMEGWSTQNKDWGKEAYTKTAPFYGPYVAMSNSMTEGVGQTTGYNRMALYAALSNYPPDTKKHGAGGHMAELTAILKYACDAHVLPQNYAQALANFQAFSGCAGVNPGVNVANCLDPSSVANLEKGAPLKAGQPAMKAMACSVLIKSAGEGAVTRVAMYNARNINEMMAMEQREMQDKRYAANPRAQLQPAVYSGVVDKDLFIRVDNENAAESVQSTFRAATMDISRHQNREGLYALWGPNVMAENGGDDKNKWLEQAFTAAGGKPCRESASYMPSQNCADQMHALAGWYASNQMNSSLASEGEANSATATNMNTLQQIIARSNATASAPTNTGFSESLQAVAQMLGSPTYIAYLQHMTPAEAEQIAQDARALAEDGDKLIATNLLDFYHQANGVVQYAENDVKKAPEDMQLSDALEKSGVDIASLMPVSYGQKPAMYTALLPTLLDQAHDTLMARRSTEPQTAQAQ